MERFHPYEDHETTAKLRKALRNLAWAEDPDVLADLFKRRGITGHKSMASGCPISKFIHQETGLRVSVTTEYGSGSVRVYNRDTAHEDDMPVYDEIVESAPMAVFVRRFDSGDYPELEFKP